MATSLYVATPDLPQEPEMRNKVRSVVIAMSGLVLLALTIASVSGAAAVVDAYTEWS